MRKGCGWIRCERHLQKISLVNTAAPQGLLIREHLDCALGYAYGPSWDGWMYG